MKRWHQIALLHEQKGEYNKAAQILRYGIATQQGAVDAEIWHLLGRQFQHLGLDLACEQAYQQTLRLNPHKAQSLNNLACLMLKRGKIREAHELLDRADRLNQPETSLLLTNTRVQILIHEGANEDAARLARSLVKLEPSATHLSNLAVAERWLGNPDIASRAQQKAIENEVGHAIEQPDSIEDAEKMIGLFEAKVHTQSDQFRRFTLVLNLGTMMLCSSPLNGTGWKLLDSRLFSNMSEDNSQQIRATLWHGAHCDHLCLWDEQGFGDTLLALRWLPEAIVRCHKATLLVRRSLLQLVAQRMTLPDHCGLQCLEDSPAPWQLAPQQIPLMSLPAALKMEWLITDPQGGYLHRSTPIGGRKGIGLTWAAGVKQDQEAERVRQNRSIPTTKIAGWIRRWQITHNTPLVSLQLGAEQRELVELGVEIDSLQENTEWEVTALMVERLNAVITVDTAMAHLCGALEVPCLLLLNSPCDWRWGQKGQKQAWYRSVTVLRCTSFNDWDTVLAEADARLRRLLA